MLLKIVVQYVGTFMIDYRYPENGHTVYIYAVYTELSTHISSN